MVLVRRSSLRAYDDVLSELLGRVIIVVGLGKLTLVSGVPSDDGDTHSSSMTNWRFK